MRIIDCHHLNERLWIKVSAVCSVACVGNGCRRIIRHEYSFEAQTITGLYRSILLQCMATARRKSVIEICREIRHRNPSENLSRNLISVPLSSEIGEIDWLKRTAISWVLVNWCNPQMFGGVHQVRHFCKRLEGNFAVSKISNFLLKVLLVGLNKRVEVQASLRWQMIWNIWILEKQ